VRNLVGSVSGWKLKHGLVPFNKSSGLIYYFQQNVNFTAVRLPIPHMNKKNVRAANAAFFSETKFRNFLPLKFKLEMSASG
jgi:hypothetical protein